eukprot:9196701-Lingulodinium_polyedra.AAC.1
MMRSSRPDAVTTARKSQARALHARAKTGARMECPGVRFASRAGAACVQLWKLLGRCLGAAWELL